MLKYLSALLFLILFLACNILEPESNRSKLVYSNPQYSIPSANVVEPGEGYPFPVEEYPLSGIKRSLGEINAFANRIKSRFNSSNCTNAEAQKLYTLLSQKLEIIDGSYGMPQPPFSSGAISLPERVMVKKLSDTEWEIFYYIIGCGKTYHLAKVTIVSDTLKIEDLERWREVFPC